MKYHGVTNYLENKSNIQTKKLNIEYFKYNIFSKEALDIIKKWHDKYLNFFINNDCIFNLSAGLDSRVLLSFLIKVDKEFLIDNYHRTTTNFKVDDKYDIEFPVKISKLLNCKLGFDHNFAKGIARQNNDGIKVYGKINESTFSGYLKGFQLYQGSFINKSNFISLEAIKIGNDAGVVVNLEYVITKQLFQWVSFLKDCINVNFFDYGRNTDWYCELERNNFYGPFLEVDTKSALEIKYSNFEGIGSNSAPVKIFKNILHSSFLEDVCGCSLQNIYSSTFYKGIKGTSNDIIIAEIDSSNIYEELNRGTIIFKLEDSTLYGPIS